MENFKKFFESIANNRKILLIQKYRDHFVSFTNIPFLKLNPKSISNPIGIYAFPINYIQQIGFKGNYPDLPGIGFFQFRKYLIIFHPKNYNKILHITNDPPDLKNDIISVLTTTYGNKAQEIYEKNLRKVSWFGLNWKKLWKLLKLLNNYNVVKLTDFILKMGYIGVWDHGTGILDQAEPTQVVFFRTIDLITDEVIINKEGNN